MGGIKTWIDEHPTLWEFIKFNVLSNCATVTNFIVMWICTLRIPQASPYFLSGITQNFMVG